MSADRPKKADMVYIQRDLEAIKHTLDQILKPYKNDVKNLREDNASLRAHAARTNADVFTLMMFISKYCPDALDAAIGTLLDPTKSGWRKFRSSWLQRLGLETKKG